MIDGNSVKTIFILDLIIVLSAGTCIDYLLLLLDLLGKGGREERKGSGDKGR